MRRSFEISLALSFMIVLSFAIFLSSSIAYFYHMPVEMQSSTYPEVFMPGDQGILTLELQNGAAKYGVGGADASRDLTLSTPINKTELKGTNEVNVTSSNYENIGLIGPDDKVKLYYRIQVADNASNGTYFLDFSVLGGYDGIQINRKIPVKVDSMGISLSRAENPTKPSISLNVANPRENTVNAVTIVPQAKGVRFSPEEYYVGTMNPDEVFTISFDISSVNPNRPISQPENISFIARFKNGETWHESDVYNAYYIPFKEARNLPIGFIIGAIVLVLLLAGGYVFKHRKDLTKEKK
ncbi:MAG: hypothetical protein MUO26_12105 [Methanotrichaceae archaeon]|nr:hypothetical protein [Methanotrichaceae archaeon]